NGDGFGDVLATDSSGSLWRFNGKLNGFAAPVKVGGGWQVYNAIIGIGDFNLDGHNDLVARNPAGALFLYRGNGDGTFQAALQIATGLQTYSKLF
ncbi:MAG TPA: VCBS repeat-containing protein, partial [Micromonosporaceae bacterium]|nr:VCBS repeat-containing protein [Micromonosporaceae bacterium]